MFYDLDELDGLDDIDIMEMQRDRQNFFTQAILASYLKF